LISFYLTIARFLESFLYAARDKDFQALAILTSVLLLSGSLFYSSHEDWGFLDAFYFCVMTMKTIGYGDLAPTTDISKIFTIIYAFISIGVFVSLAAKLATSLMQYHRILGKDKKQ